MQIEALILERLKHLDHKSNSRDEKIARYGFDVESPQATFELASGKTAPKEF